MTRPTNDTDENRIAELLLQWEELAEQGQDISAEELCTDCPELVEELARRIHALKSLEWVNKPVDGDDDGDPVEDHVPPPEPLVGRYRLDRFVAEGGFGQVWQGFDLELERTVAVKMPKASRMASVENFVAEARRVAQLKHPGIVPVFDVVREGTNCLIVSEFVEGGSLADRIGTLDVKESVRLIAEVADTLNYAHQQGFVHRDIKPSNILIDHHGRALLTDFGIASSIRDSTETASLGTLAYMSPEQIEANSVDHRSDVFSLGVVLVELLSGKRPFADDDLARLRDRNLPLSAVPSALKPVCERCLAHDPAVRYSDAASLAVALRASNEHRPSRRLWAAVPVILLLVIAGGFLANQFFPSKEPESPVAHVPPSPNFSSPAKSKKPTSPMPKAAEAVHRQAGDLFNAGRIAEALPLLDRAAELDPTNAEILKNRGIAHLNLRNFDLAVADLETALKLDANHSADYRKILSQIHVASAVKLSESQSWPEAIAEMDRAIAHLPTADYFHRRASMYYNGKQFEQAIADWTEAIRLEPSIGTYYEHRGYALTATGRKADAAEDFEKAGQLSGP